MTEFDKDEPLRRDVRALGELLGAVLREQGESFWPVETARRTSQRRRSRDQAAEQELAAQLGGLAADAALDIARAFSAYFSLVNLAERVHRVRRRRSYEQSGEAQPDGIRAVLEEAKAAGRSADDVFDTLRGIRIESVFTAHPTEAIRRTILVKELDIARALTEAIDLQLTGPHARELMVRIRRDVTTMWQTEEQLSTRPSVADEVEHVAFFVTEVLHGVVARFYAMIDRAFGPVYGVATPHLEQPLLRFCSWVGGDMDGNPNVDAETIRVTLSRHAELARDLHLADLRSLFRVLSQSHTRVGVARAVTDRIESYRKARPEALAEIPDRYQDMPYRVLLWLMSDRLRRAGEDGGYGGANELVADLAVIAESLADNRGESAGRDLVVDCMLRVATFGFHLMTLDTRQDALDLRRAAGALLGDPEFGGRTASERAASLAEALSTSPPSTDNRDAQRCLSVFRAIREGRERYGADATGLAIVSMAQGPDDTLTTLLLARSAALVDEAGNVPLDVAPLFETVDDLDRSAKTLEALLRDPGYRRHLESRGDVQHVMLGYSDSNKDSGIVASRWALYRAQLVLVRVADEHGVEVAFFHGRGGTISRGGGKPRRGILAEPCASGHLRVTEQGEMVRAKFGLPEIAERTFELITGALLTRAAEGHRSPEPETARLVDECAGASRAAYRALVHEHPAFFDYFRAATPIDVIERLRIGSRPASRRSQRGIDDLRAIPWVFAWTQSRHLLTGWFGAGRGLEACVQSRGLSRVREVARDWPFFANLLSDFEMVLAKADMPIAKRYADLAGAAGDEVYPILLEEFERTRAYVCEIVECDELLDREPVLQRSIQLRNPYVDPMSFLQVDLLARWRATGREDPELERALAATVQGIARGMQSTG